MQEKPTSFSIKNWSQDDQPREKLLYKGKAVLSDAELVAILVLLPLWSWEDDAEEKML